MSEDYVVQYLDGESERLNWIARKGNVSIQYASGASFEGFLNDSRLKHGHGAYKFALGNGDENAGSAEPKVFKGNYVNGKKSGFGVLEWTNGMKYKGLWSNNKQHGIGTMTYPNGDIYSGGWANGKRNGHGAYVYAATGAQLIGDWKNGSLGTGNWLFPNDSSWTGGFTKSGQPRGRGIFHHSSGLDQEGEFKQRGLEGQENGEEEDGESGTSTFVASTLTESFVPHSKLNPPLGEVSTQNDYSIQRKPAVVESKENVLGDSSTPRRKVVNEPIDDEITQLFRAVDTNGDEKVTIAELSNYLESNPEKFTNIIGEFPDLASPEVQKVLVEVDQDGDGRLSLPELYQYIDLKALFKKCDQDGSGQVSHGELVSAIMDNDIRFPDAFEQQSKSRASVSARITELDQNDDRLLSFAEFVRIFFVF